MLIRNLKKTALVGEGFSFDYHQLLEQIDYYAVKFIRNRGQKILLFSENRPEWIFVLYAAWKTNGIVIPVDYLSTPEEVAFILSDSRPEMVFCSEAKRSIIDSALIISDCHPELLVFEDTGLSGKAGDHNHEGINIPGLSDVALINYTSGTTGSPKGVMLTFKNLLTNIVAVSESVPIITRDERILLLLPLHHILPIMGTVVIPFYAGSMVAMAPSMSSEDIINTLQKHKISIIIGVPRLYNAIRKGIMDKIHSSKIATFIFTIAKLAGSRKLSAILFKKVHQKFGGNIKYLVSGGAAIDRQVVKDFNILGFELLEGYGMSEAAPMITFCRPAKVKLGSVGQAVPGVLVELREGEIVAKGDNIMKGYYNKPAETKEVLIDGWLFTGDLGHIDKDGYLYITGRKKDLIILSNGKNINPEEIEAKLEKVSPAVREAGVYALNDTLNAVLLPNFEWLKAQQIDNIHEYFKWEIIDNYNTQVSPYKKILSFALVNEDLPKTRLGKIQHYKLDKFTVHIKNRTTEDTIKEFQEYVLLKKFIEEQLERKVKPFDHIEMDLAIDSLGLVSLSVFVHASFGIDIRESEFAKFDSVVKLAEYIRDNRTKMVVEKINWTNILKAPFHFKLSESGIIGTLSRYFWRFLLRLYFRIRADGLSNLPDGPCIIAPNHQSFFDGFFLAAAFRNRLMKKTYFYAKEKHFRTGWLKAFARKHNIIIMDINKDLRQSIQKLAELLKKGKNIIIFPEGTRSKDGRLGQFKKTFAILAQELNIPVVPVIINGSFSAMPSGSLLPKPFSRIDIRILQPVYPENHTYDSLRDIVFKKISYELR
jgi:long-chain acyl-CoA synthetase